MDAIFFLNHIAIILLIGLLCSLLSSRLKISNTLLLIVAGIILSLFQFKGSSLISFTQPFLAGLGLLTLVIVLFDSAYRLGTTKISKLAIRMALTSLVLNVIVLSSATLLIYQGADPLVIVAFAVMMSGADHLPRKTPTQIHDLLEEESVLTTPLVILIPFLFLAFARGSMVIVGSSFLPFLNYLVLGVISGVIVGYVTFVILRFAFKEKFKIVVLVAAILAYIMAERLGGSGVLAVAIMGLVFGSKREKALIEEFAPTFSTMLEIFVIVLLGVIVVLPISLDFIVKSLMLFIVYLFVRYLTVHLSLGKRYTPDEKLFMTVNLPKGMAIAVLAFALSTELFLGATVGLDLVLAFMLYSMILAVLVKHPEVAKPL